MSAIASVEVVSPPEPTPAQVAVAIDRQLSHVAQNAPVEVKRHGFAGQETLLHEVLGLGALYLVNLGRVPEYDNNFSIRVIAQADANKSLGFYKDFVLDYWQRPIEVDQTSPEDLTDCPAPLSMLQYLTRTLHDGYMGQLQPVEQEATVVAFPMERISH